MIHLLSRSHYHGRIAGYFILAIFLFISSHQSGWADPHPGQSSNVVIIGGSTLSNTVPCTMISSAANSMYATFGGCLPVTGLPGELGDFIFTPMLPVNVTALNLANFDTAVLNMASSAMACDATRLSATAKTDLINFVAGGKKLIIYDSECFPGPVDYSWLPYAFTTANPGALGQQGTLTIVEDNTLSTLVGDPSCLSGDIHCINAAALSTSTDAIGDMNVMTTFDPNWCVDMSGTNAINITGPVHTYAKYPAGTDAGLIIYNGMDVDFLTLNNADLSKVWLQELQQPFNTSDLPCGVTVVGITLNPASATNYVGEEHTVTAELKDLLGNPQAGIVVSFEVTSGPNTGATGSCTVNADCSSDASGQVSFNYLGSGGIGTDRIEACFTDQQSNEVCSQIVSKEWIAPSVLNGRMSGGGSVFTSDGTRVTHGFTLYCDVSNSPNNLQVNWGAGNKFKLENLAMATCIDDPLIESQPPAASFDTYNGMGTGRYNGESGATVRWSFTDEGEPGVQDKVMIYIEDAGGNVVLNVSGLLDRGNQQAHTDK